MCTLCCREYTWQWIKIWISVALGLVNLYFILALLVALSELFLLGSSILLIMGTCHMLKGHLGQAQPGSSVRFLLAFYLKTIGALCPQVCFTSCLASL